jgi:hypothetical protein
MASHSFAADLKLKNNAVLSAWIIVAITIVALLGGLGIRQSVQGQDAPQQRLGVSAAFPNGWVVEKGIAVSGVVFTARAPLDMTQTYTIGMEPAAQTSQLGDIAYNRNLKRAQDLDMYTVLDQQAVTFMGKDAYKVHFAYVQAGNGHSLPVVIEGLDYYFSAQPKVMVVTFEEDTTMFNQALPRFMQFLGSVSYTSGGAQ